MITAERLREVVDYDPESGIFRWRIKPNRNILVGSIAGFRTTGRYWAIGIDGRTYGAHRLAWLYVHGEWPEGDIDHRNGNREDNRIANLRPIDDVSNGQNQHRPQSGNTSGFLGVSLNRGKWQAGIKADGRVRYLGRYDTPEEAHEVYLAAKRLLHPGWDELAS